MKMSKKLLIVILIIVIGVAIGITATTGVLDPARGIYQEGEELRRTGEYGLAIEKYFSIIDKHPGSQYATEAAERIPQCYYEWGADLEERGAYEDAIKTYQTTIDDYPDSIWSSRASEAIERVSQYYIQWGSNETVVVNFIGGAFVDAEPAVPCWEHPGWYKPTDSEKDMGVIWVWSTEYVTPEEAEKGSLRIFRRMLDLTDVDYTNVKIQVAVDNKVLVSVNGHWVAYVSTFKNLSGPIDITKFVTKDAVNEFVFIVVSDTSGPEAPPEALTSEANPAGLIYKIIAS